MKQLPLEQVEPGMVLCEDAVDADGHVLLLKGHVLDEKYLGVLRKRGIEEVKVEEPQQLPEESPAPKPAPVEADEEAIAQEEIRRRKAHMERIQHMFEGRLDDPVMKQIFTVAIKRAHAGVTRD